MIETQSEFQDPPRNPPVAIATDEDPIRDLGDRIIALSPEKVKQLKEYLNVLL